MTSLTPPASELLTDPVRLPPPPVGRAIIPTRAAGGRPAPVSPAPGAGFADGVWDEAPSVPNQLQIPDAVKPDKVEVLTLRMSDAEEAKRYADILANVRSNRARWQIVEHDRQFHNGTWLVFLVLQHFLFKRTLDLRKPSP